MDNGYRGIAIGEICQEGDEIKCRDRDWVRINHHYHGSAYSLQDFKNSIFRRPIAQDEPQVYTSDTKPVVEKPSVDVCANNEPDLQMMYALAPVDATHVDPLDLTYLKQLNNNECLAFVDLEWHECSLEQEAMFRIVRIPDRELELNRWSDENSYFKAGHVRHDINYDDVKARRAIRKSKTMPDVVEAESKWLPDIGEECEWFSYRTNCWHITKIKAYDDEGQAWLDGEGVVDIDVHYEQFRPIKTAKQIALEERKNAIDAMLDCCPRPKSRWTEADCEALYDAGYRITKKDKGDD